MKYTIEQLSKPRIVTIEKVTVESPTVKSFTFTDHLCEIAFPGQFIMVWIPDIDEIPMSITHEIGSQKSKIWVKLTGMATEKMHELNIGDVIGIRGPYGNNFSTSPNEQILVIAGGTGIVPLLDILMNLDHDRLYLFYGAKNKSAFLLLDEIEKRIKNLYLVTEEGDLGEKGFLSHIVEAHLTTDLSEKKFNTIFCCGPEIMLQNIFQISEKLHIPIQASLESIMKCGVGICGSCERDGYRICVDGPVFHSQDLRCLKSLGISKRDHSGKKIEVIK